MEKIVYDYPAGKPAQRRVLVGVVGSGDLEVLLEPSAAGTTSISITTSVNGMSKLWKAVLTRIFTATLLPAAKIEINDCGATPGVVRMRLEQAFEELNESEVRKP